MSIFEKKFSFIFIFEFRLWNIYLRGLLNQLYHKKNICKLSCKKFGLFVKKPLKGALMATRSIDAFFIISSKDLQHHDHSINKNDAQSPPRQRSWLVFFVADRPKGGSPEQKSGQKQ